MGTDGGKLQALRDFLLSSFDRHGLQMFLRFNGYGDVVDAVAWDAPATVYSFVVVATLDQRGLVDAELFRRLRHERPGRAAELEAVRSAWVGDTPSEPEPLSDTARTDPGPAPRPAVDRLALVRRLAGLDPSDFAVVVAMIPNAARHVSRHGTVPEQAAELIRWVEGSTDHGLAAVLEALDSFR